MGGLTDDRGNLLRSVAETSPLALAVSEGPSHVLTYVNPAFCRQYNRPATDLLGHPFAEVCPQESRAVCSLLDRVFETRAAESLADLSGEGSGSELTCWSYAAWPLLDHEAVATQVTDTSGHQRTASERDGDLQRVNQQLLLAALREEERSEKLQVADRAKDEFLAMLAHELRNPLAAIRTGIYLLNERAAPTDDDTHQTCALLEHQVHHFSRLLDDLLDVARITRGKIELQVEPVDVVRVLRHVVAANRSLLERNRHELTMKLPSAPVWVDADSVRLEQVVSNLLQNASKYTEPDGKIWLSLETVPHGLSERASRGIDTAVVRVRDTGVGISPEALLHVFDLFVQGDPASLPKRGGLGIGLTLVQRLVELHGGQVEAWSAGLGQGSEFRVLLPLREAAPDLPAAPKEPHAASGGAVILLVEDNVAAAATLADVLELWGYEVTTAYSAAKALSLAAVTRADMVLLDIGLPDMDGYELARRLRAEAGFNGVPLVALTGYGRADDRERSREAGIDFHLTKPVDLDELRRIIGSCLAPAAGGGGGRND
jgi:signal transduction histidine kinase